MSNFTFHAKLIYWTGAHEVCAFKMSGIVCFDVYVLCLCKYVKHTQIIRMLKIPEGGCTNVQRQTMERYPQFLLHIDVHCLADQWDHLYSACRVAVSGKHFRKIQPESVFVGAWSQTTIYLQKSYGKNMKVTDHQIHIFKIIQWRARLTKDLAMKINV